MQLQPEVFQADTKTVAEINDKLIFLLQKSNQQQEIIVNLTNRVQELELQKSLREEPNNPAIQLPQTRKKQTNFVPAIPIDTDGNTQIEDRSNSEPTEPQPLDWVKVVTARQAKGP